MGVYKVPGSTGTYFVPLGDLISISSFFFSTVKLGEFNYGLEKFEEAHSLAVSLNDDAAQSAITKAITDLKERIESK